MGKKTWFYGKSLIITGGTSGIGLAIAKQLLKRGAHIIALTNDREEIESVNAEMSHSKKDFIAVECDVTSDQSRSSFKQWLESRNFDLVGLINCAGITTFGSFFETSPEHLKKVLRTNLEGAVLFTREIFPLVLSDARSDLIYLGFISSITSEEPAPFFGAYSASKAGLDMFARTLKEELPKNVKVLIARPTAVRTPFYDRALVTAKSDLKGFTEQSKKLFITPDQVANSFVKAIVKKKSGILYPGFKTKFHRITLKIPVTRWLLRRSSISLLRKKVSSK